MSKEQTKQVVFSILLFLVAFSLWQAYFLFHAANPQIPVSYTYVLYFTIHLANLALFFIFVKLEKSKLSEHGFKEPANMRLCLALSISSIILFLTVTLATGFMWGFSSPSFPHNFFYFTFSILNAIIVSLTTESIFRGYIFKGMMGKLGFFTSLYASSIMFSLYQIPIPTLITMSTNDIITYMFTDILPLFAAGLFLGFFFYKTGWSLTGPAIFRAGTLLYLFLPPVMATPPWWMKLTSEVAAYACLIILLEATIREPKFLRKKYGLES